MRRLVVTADDLGRDPATTDVVLDLLAGGLVTATTLIPVSPGAEAAARRVRELGVVPRLHLTLTGERGLPPWRPLAATRSLTGPDGTLAVDPFLLGARGEAADVVAELDAQLAWFHAHDLAPVAADSHAGTLYGLHGRSWLPETLAWCARHGLSFRLPRDPRPYFGGPLPPALVEQHAQAVALADGLGVPIPAAIWTRPAGVGSYDDLRAGLIARLDSLPDGVSELFLHPSTADASADGVVRAWEARLLRDPAWSGALARSGVELVGGWA